MQKSWVLPKLRGKGRSKAARQKQVTAEAPFAAGIENSCSRGRKQQTGLQKKAEKAVRYKGKLA